MTQPFEKQTQKTIKIAIFKLDTMTVGLKKHHRMNSKQLRG